MKEDKIRLLIVDDLAYIRLSIKTLLQKKTDIKYIREASDGIKAIEEFKMFRPDIVLLDLSLPKISGLNLIPIFLQMNPKIKILIVSIDIEIATKKKAIESGALNYITKPIDSNILIKAVRNLINSESLISQKAIENLNRKSDVYTEKIEVKLDIPKSTQILNIKGSLTEKDINDIKNTILSLQAFHYKNLIINLLNVSELSIESASLVSIKSSIEKNGGHFYIITDNDSSDYKNNPDFSYIIFNSLKDAIERINNN